MKNKATKKIHAQKRPNNITSAESQLKNLIVSNSSITDVLGENIIISTEDKIRLCLIEYTKSVEKKRTRITPLGMVSTIAICFLTSNFKERLGITKENREAIFIIGGIACVIWLLKEIYDCFSKNMSIDDIIKEMKKNALKSNLQNN